MEKRFMLIIAVVLSITVLFTGIAWADAAVDGGHNYQDADFYVVVDAPDGYVNFRYGPGLEYGIYEPIYNGEVLHIIQTADNYYDELSWGETPYDGRYGWVSLSQVTYQEASSDDTYIQPLPDYQQGAVQAIWGEQEEPLVSDAYKYVKTVHDSEYSYAIPRINLTSEYIYSLNEETYDDLAEEVRHSVTRLEEGQILTVDELLVLSYKWYQNEDILSIVLYAAFGGPWHDLSAVNISIPEERVMEDYEIYERAGYTEEQYKEVVSMAMDNAFLSLNENVVSRMEMSQDETNIYNRLRNENTSEDNLSLAVPYMSEEGDIRIIAPIKLFMMQNSESWSIIDLKTGEVLKWKEDTEDTVPEAAYGDPADYYMAVSAPDNYCNLRKGPGMAYDIITPIYNGEYLHIYEVSYNSYDDLYWGRTEYNGLTGWISISQASAILP